MNIKDSIRHFFYKKTGLEARFDKTNERIDSLYFYLNEFVDIRKITHTKDRDLHLLQRCDAVLLAIFHKCCEKYGLRYWLSFGTLLGAARHKGFVPWDDDTDVSMPRKDWEAALELFPSILKKYGISFYFKEGRLCMEYSHQRTGIWIDVFVVDSYWADKNNTREMQQLSQRVSQYSKIRRRSSGFFELSWNEQSDIRNKIIGEGNGPNEILMVCGFNDVFLLDSSYIFPLTAISFEDFTLNVPYDIDSVLKEIYGNYMLFPEHGLLHHGEAFGRPPLSQWAKLHDVDMNNVEQELRRILEYL